MREFVNRVYSGLIWQCHQLTLFGGRSVTWEQEASAKSAHKFKSDGAKDEPRVSAKPFRLEQRIIQIVLTAFFFTYTP